MLAQIKNYDPVTGEGKVGDRVVKLESGQVEQIGAKFYVRVSAHDYSYHKTPYGGRFCVWLGGSRDPKDACLVPRPEIILN